MAMNTDDDSRVDLDLLAEEFVERERRGDRPSIAEYAEAHPDLADDIESIFPLLSVMESVKREPATGDALPEGEEIGDYRLLRIIGRGGMGVVYEAEQKTLGRRVALKVLPNMAQLDPRTVERFRVEAQAAARLKHPRIVPVIGYGEDDGVHFYTMQYIDGRGLDEIIEEAREAGSVTADHYRSGARLILQAADGIAHAHANGVLHRDVKPSNLMIDKDGSVWITDFGLAKADDSGDLTRTGDVLGTLRYMPPERFRGESDARGDVYGLGITLYELLTRRRAYAEEDRAALAAQIATSTPSRPRALDPGIPVDLDTIVRKAMAREPAQRYATVEEMAGDLRAFLDGRPIAARAPSLGYLLRSAIGRHKPLAITGAVALLLLVAMSVWYVRDLAKERREARFGQYVASLAASEAAGRIGSTRHAEVLLDEAPAEFRNWEWQHLRNGLDPSIRAFESKPVNVLDIRHHPSGKWFAATMGGEVWIYDDDTGEIVRKLEPQSQPVFMRWSPTGNCLAMTTRETAEVWSWPGGELMARLSGSHGEVAFLRGGAEVAFAMGGVDGAIVRTDLEGNELARTQLDAAILGMDCHPGPDGDRMAVATIDGHVRMLRADDGQETWRRRVSRRLLGTVLFLGPDRVACSTSGLVRIFDTKDGRERDPFATDGYSARMVWDAPRRRLLIYGLGRIYVASPDDPLRPRLLAGAVRSTSSLHPDGRRLVVNTQGGLRERYLGLGDDPRALTGHLSDLGSVDTSPDGRLAASVGFGGIIRLRDLTTGEQTRTLLGAGSASSVRFSPTGDRILTIYTNGEAAEFDTSTCKPTARWRVTEQRQWYFADYVDSSRVVTLTEDGRLGLWELPTGRAVAQQPIGEAVATRVVVGHAGRVIATGDQAGLIRLWNAETLAPMQVLRGHERAITGLAFHPNRALLASVGTDDTARLWAVPSGREVHRNQAPFTAAAWDQSLSCCAFSPDGTRLVAGSYYGVVHVWDVPALRLLVQIKGGRWTNELAFTPDGTRVLLAMSHGLLRILDSEPLRNRVPTIEEAVELSLRARPIVDDMSEAWRDPDALVAAIAARDDLEPRIQESAFRIAHTRRASPEGLLRIMWRDLTPAQGNREAQLAALAAAFGQHRGLRHRRQDDPRFETLLVMALVRTGRFERALSLLDQFLAGHEHRAPDLYATDLAFATLAHAGLAQAAEAREALSRLETLLGERAELATERVRGFLAEARAAVRGE